MCTQCNSYKSEFTYEMSSLILLQITDLNEKIKAETDSATKYKKSCAELQQVSLVYIKSPKTMVISQLLGLHFYCCDINRKGILKCKKNIEYFGPT